MIFISNNKKRILKGGIFFPNFCTDIDKKENIYIKTFQESFFSPLPLFFLHFNLLIGLVKLSAFVV